MKRSTIKLAGLVAVGLVIGGTAAAVTESHAARSSSTSTISELPLVGSVAETAGVSGLTPALPGLPTTGLPTDDLVSQLPVSKLPVSVSQLPGASNLPAPTEQLDLPIASDLAGLDLLGGLTQQLGGLLGGLPIGALGS